MAIEVNHLHFGYDDKLLLKDFTFKIEKGRIYALLGCNGSGKTTLIKLINGLLTPLKGSVLLDGIDIRTLDIKALSQKVTTVLQEHRETYPYSVSEMVVMGRNPYLGLFSSPSVEDYGVVEEALKMTGIYHLKERNYIELSGGEKQLVFMARAIVQETPYLLLDEPTAHLDFSNQYRIMEVIRRIVKKRKIGVVISLHDPNLALSFGDYGIMIGRGNIIEQGPIDLITTRHNLEILYHADIDMGYTQEGRKFISIKQNLKHHHWSII